MGLGDEYLNTGWTIIITIWTQPTYSLVDNNSGKDDDWIVFPASGSYIFQKEIVADLFSFFTTGTSILHSLIGLAWEVRFLWMEEQGDEYFLPAIILQIIWAGEPGK